MSKNRDGVLRRTQYIAEYAAVRTLSAAVGLLPERLAVFAGRALGRLFWLVGVRRRRIARQNIEKAMPGELTAKEIRRLVKQVFIHIGLTVVETLWTRTHTDKENIDQRFPTEGLDVVEAELARGRGVILVGGHFGNWEIFGERLAAALPRTHALARPVNNPLVRAYTTRLRERFGMNVLNTRDGVRPMLRALKASDVLMVLIDQHVNRAFVPATFFGRPAATTAVVASLALRTSAPVFAAYSLRQEQSFRHRGYIGAPIELVRTGDHEADVRANTQMFNDKLEETVQQHPEQWLWTHRRWKLADRLERERERENADVG